MATLKIKILEPQVLALLQSLESLNLIKISPEKLLARNGKKAVPKNGQPALPITPADEPEGDMMQLFGIWKDNPVTSDQLRKLAWGDRL